ncbi:MAG: EamA family transporter [Solirubrobacteraceae bacterium]
MTDPAQPATAALPASSLRVWAALGAVYLIWGSTYLAIRVMVETVPALLGAGIRFVLAGVLLLALLAIRGGARRVVLDRRMLLRVALVGTLLAAGGNGLVTIAEKNVPSALAALIVASTPLWIVVFRSVFHDRPATTTLAGVALGFLGVALLLLPGNRPDGVELLPTLVIVLAAVSWGFGSFLSQRMTMPGDPLVSTGWQMLAGGVVLMIVAVPTGEYGEFDVGEFSGDSIWALIFLVVVGSLVAYSAYTWLLQSAPISQVATYAYVNPMVAVLLGWLILDEHIPPMMLVASVVIVAAVATIVRNEARARQAVARRAT